MEIQNWKSQENLKWKWSEIPKTEMIGMETKMKMNESEVKVQKQKRIKKLSWNWNEIPY